jgi:hypothetical protein
MIDFPTVHAKEVTNVLAQKSLDENCTYSTLHMV